jgi:hypothetical protein
MVAWNVAEAPESSGWAFVKPFGVRGLVTLWQEHALNGQENV